MKESRPGWPGSFIQPNKDAGGCRQAQVISPKLSQASKNSGHQSEPGSERNKPAKPCANDQAKSGGSLLPSSSKSKYASTKPAMKKQRTNNGAAATAVAQSEEDRIAAAQLAAKPKPRTSSYQRPKQREKPPFQRSIMPVQQANVERLERAVVCGRLWYQGCREANQDLPKDLPVTFASATQYIKAYEPLIFEEARESLLRCRLDQYTVESPARVISTERLPSGWSEVTLFLEKGGSVVKEGALVVVSDRQMPPKASIEWFVDAAKGCGSNKHAGRSAKRASSPMPRTDEEGGGADDFVLLGGVVRKAPPIGQHGDIIVGVHPLCPAHSNDTEAPCGKALGCLRPRMKVWLVITSPMVTQQREFHALHKAPSMSVGHYMLHPVELAALGAAVEAQHQGQPLRIPKDCGEAVQQQLASQFDSTQFRAIVAATRHLDGGPSGKTMPFVLICGPPGTGKTHTVTGILNVWHLTHYTRHQNSVIDKMRSSFAQGDILAAAAGLNSSVHGLAAKPRLLVCAPSNAAADELLQRVMTTGFCGNDKRAYFPNVVRVGAPGANIGEKAKAVLVDGLVQALLEMDPTTWQHQVRQTEAAIAHLSQHIATLQHHLSLLQVPLWVQEEAGPARDLALRQEVDTVRQLVERHDASSKQLLHRERLATIADHVNGRPGAALSEVRDSVELLFVEDAEMVFTTLSSTGRKVFGRLSPGHFETVLIDEAAQASEVTTLQALTFGCRRVVLVGDPQQLPATVLSQRGKELLLERSLFERLQQAGCPVHMLQVQYRMHPSIRDFPSAHFYDSKLQDGPSVLSRPPEVFYENKLLKPYVFFDVSQGRDVVASVGSNTGSRRNQEEADLAVALFQVLREELITAMERKQLKKPVMVGVITPYREQVACIQTTLTYVLGCELASEVCVSTVDSYQGRQLDVIILSCVRANRSAAGVGFVADMRRMNVSITRAKRALWILGSAATLHHSPVWAALLDDARRRGLLIQKASARSLFPHLPQFQPGFKSPAEGVQAPRSSVTKQGPDMFDQQLQESHRRSSSSSSRMMRELETGCGSGIPGLGPVAPPEPAGRRHAHGAAFRRPGSSSRDASPMPEDARLYGEEAAGPPSSRSASPARGREPGARNSGEAAPDFAAYDNDSFDGFVPTEEVQLRGKRRSKSPPDPGKITPPQLGGQDHPTALPVAHIGDETAPSSPIPRKPSQERLLDESKAETGSSVVQHTGGNVQLDLSRASSADGLGSGRHVQKRQNKGSSMR